MDGEPRSPKVIRKRGGEIRHKPIASFSTYPGSSDALTGGGGARECPSEEEDQKSAEGVVSGLITEKA